MRTATSIQEVGISVIARPDDGSEVDITAALHRYMDGPQYLPKLPQRELAGVLRSLDLEE